MVATFEHMLSRSGNKKTDSRLQTPFTATPLRMPSASPRPVSKPFVSDQQSWYRSDWGTGGNVFPAHIRPADPGKPWNRPASSMAQQDARPAHLFAPLGQSPRTMRDTLDRSLTSTGWVANYDAGKWATDLLPKRPGKIAASLGGDKCSRPYQTEEKASPFWQPAMHQRTNRKPAVNGTPTMFALNGTSPYVLHPT